jgi:hypothetical protein
MVTPSNALATAPSGVGWIAAVACCAQILPIVVRLTCTAPAASRAMRPAHQMLDDGLFELKAKVIAHGSAGFPWLGSEAGLDRYDGEQFQHFRKSPRGCCATRHLPGNDWSDS